jgi:hypothetical protein
MQTRPFAPAIALAATALITACGAVAGASGGSTGGTGGAAPAPSTATVTVTATIAPPTLGLTDPVTPDPALLSTPPPTGAPMVPADPQAYGQAFVTAWVDRDRATAAHLGTPTAVSSAFARTATTAPVFEKCEGAAGSSYCTWQGQKYSLIVRIGNERVAQHQDQAVFEVRFTG